MLCRGVCICVLADAGCPGISWVLRRWFSKLLRPDVSSSFTPASRLSSEIPSIEGCEERGRRCYLLHFSININISAFSADCRSTTAHSQLSLVQTFLRACQMILWLLAGMRHFALAEYLMWQCVITAVTIRHWRLFSNNKMLNMQNVARTDDRMHNCAIFATIHQKTITNNTITSICCWFWKLSINTLSVQINLICHLHCYEFNLHLYYQYRNL